MAQTRKPLPCGTSNDNKSGFMIHPSAFPNYTPSPFESAWRWSPARSVPRPRWIARCGYSNPPFQLGVPGSSRRQPAPGAHWRRKPSTEPRTVALLARCIAPFFVLDENGVLPRNRWKRKNGGLLNERLFCMSFFNVFIGDRRGQLATRIPLRRREL